MVNVLHLAVIKSLGVHERLPQEWRQVQASRASLLCVLEQGTLIIPPFFKKAMGIMQSPPSVTLSPSQPLDEIQPNLVCE